MTAAHGRPSEPPREPPDEELASALQAQIEGLFGVRGARVVVEPDGVLSVRVLTLPEGDQESLRSEIRAVADRFGLWVDPTRIQFFQTAVSAPRGGRRRLSHVTVTRSGDSVTVSVALELEGDLVLGEEIGVGARGGMRAAALATLDALKTLLPEPVELGSVDVLQVATTQLAVVTVYHHAGLLSGSAMVRADLVDASVRAVLDALNRALSAARPAEGDRRR